MKKMNNKGFSLVELIVVIAIMAVLVGVLAPQFIKYVEKSRESTDIQTCDNIVSSLKTYLSDKEGIDTTYEITLSHNTIDYTTDASGHAAKAVADAGMGEAKITGNNWDSIKITYTTSDGTVAYDITPASGKTPYYTTSGGRFIAE